MAEGTEFRSRQSIQELSTILPERLPQLEWRLRDSEYDGLYIAGRTTDGAKVKITSEGKQGCYRLDVYSYLMNAEVSPDEKERIRLGL